MYEVIATESSIWIVTELCSGGELFDYLAEKGRLGEEETKILFGQLCLAVYYLHEKGIVHRDLKLENVLLDERCRVKLGDFGFTREYERGAYMETFCGTTGYASPEMLQGKKYLGPEVDVWSLGIILYCLLTGTLPFDDDDDDVMRDMIIQGDFEDPEWLSPEARGLIQNIIVKDPTKRLTIPQILAHPWFTTASPSNTSTHSLSMLQPSVPQSRQPSPPPSLDTSPMFAPQPLDPANPLSAGSSAASDSTFISASSKFATSTPTTPDDQSNQDPFDSVAVKDHESVIHRTPSENTLRTLVFPVKSSQQPETSTVIEEEPANSEEATPMRPQIQRSATIATTASSSGSVSKAPPPAYPARTPARTKRRSVSSTLSDPDHPVSPTTEAANTKALPPLPVQDFHSILNTPAPMIFSTQLERALLNSFSLLGLDTAQVVHSVLSDACDASGAMWWMLKRKAEKTAVEDDQAKLHTAAFKSNGALVEKGRESEPDKKRHRRPSNATRDTSKGPILVSVSVQTDAPQTPVMPFLSIAQSAPELAFVPPTPIVSKVRDPRMTTPPRNASPTGGLAPSTTSTILGSGELTKSPVSSLREKEGSKGRRDGKSRSGSVSIMQRATTALEAAGLVRKKSSEAVKDQLEREKEKEKEREKERQNSKDLDKKPLSGEESRSSYGSGTSKLTKSPPMRAVRDSTATPPPSDDLHHPQPTIGSPWVVTGSKTSPLQNSTPTPANSPGDTLTSLPNFTENGNKAPNRNRASLLSAFRFWFNEDRKGKRKDPAPHASPNARQPIYRNAHSAPNMTPAKQGSVKRASGSASKANKSSQRGKRHSTSSRRSSSVNSKRSSGTSAMLMDSPHIVVETRRSFGAHTPNSERGEYSSRPSSIRSFSMTRHRKSPSQSSSGSAHLRSSSPLQKYHRRAGSGSSTRVVRQVARPTHVRTNSTTSSIHSRASSRPTSFYEELDNISRTASPMKRAFDETTPRKSGSSTFVAQKRQTPFTSPHGNPNLHSISRSSWKKSWGLEPPGWQSRATHIPIEVLSMSPAVDSPNGIRDVFTGRGSLSLGDDDEWVDEDDDVPAFAGGLGQMATSASGLSASHSLFGQLIQESPMTLSPPSRNNGSARSNKRNANTSANGAARQKAAQATTGRTSPDPIEAPHEASDSRTGSGRRQLPAVRTGPAFRSHPIVEEDEGEEEEE
ncbi:Pkinase-domain-containing protein [Athelia psychrophila]|uniref:Pkinase-domain-containing protein n=1 Tax=Athelia psychrophila TaxID=1759441 RepID=A0A166DN91_9AGAM|nr:Pkinase-domain-containing protein [Fibularhizoctonia sp. CBS 109695]